MLKQFYKNAEFIDFEAETEGNDDHDDEVSNISDSDSLKSIIGNEEINTDVSLYRHFNNIETDIEQTLKDENINALEEIDDYDKISNLCESSEEELEIDDFKNAQ